MLTRMVHKNEEKDAARSVLSLPSLAHTKMLRPICPSSVDQPIISLPWIAIHPFRPLRYNPSELSMLTVFLRSFSTQLQAAAAFEAKIVPRSLTQVDYETQAPDTTEIGKLCDRTAANVPDPVFHPAFCRSYSFAGCRCCKAAPSCFAAVRFSSSPEEGPLSARGGA